MGPSSNEFHPPHFKKSIATVATTLQLSLSWVVDGEGQLWTVGSAEDRGVYRVLEMVYCGLLVQEIGALARYLKGDFLLLGIDSG